MMIWALLLEMVTLVSTITATTADPINWRTRRVLNWADFKGTPVTTAPNAALTSTSILINYRYNTESLQFRLNCVFYPHKSWTKVNTQQILAHEQGHFDISQLYTRKLYHALTAYRFNAASVEKDIQAIYQRITNEQAAYQNLYDKETNYSRDAAAQQSWIERIEKELEETKAFADYPEE
ncbi:DUF922 domain-containing protein [Flavihumibacter sp. CACIAM 22H1]|uniref:DUF922 domain-containing protein n=1 Tax=Flavihumibacter sp. CACIAM 22H1 TaxID=1812911 RepID=UPI0007A82C30|nr:DUF922 domain-containing protein [Flavihumibacter sp. CACIAM 22H1]KYP12925.1 MAG: hypothetical protein A1D16_02270 [Flavihumibacter sp. CACIAM 22H1]